MTFTLESFVRKTFPVVGVQITEDNMAEIAAWCGGRVQHTEDIPHWRGKKGSFIKIEITRAQTRRQTMGFVGDWVLRSGETSFKIYGEKSFVGAFEKPPAVENQVSGEKFEKIFGVVKAAMTKQDVATYLEDPKVAEGVARSAAVEICNL